VLGSGNFWLIATFMSQRGVTCIANRYIFYNQRLDAKVIRNKREGE
jgi:hypothetical protein